MHLDEFDEESFVEAKVADSPTKLSPVKESIAAATVAHQSVVSNAKETRKVSVTAFETRKRSSAVRDEEEYIPQLVISTSLKRLLLFQSLVFLFMQDCVLQKS